jgi:hypothetical protein
MISNMRPSLFRLPLQQQQSIPSNGFRVLVGLLDKTVHPSSILQRLFEQSWVFNDVQQVCCCTVIWHLSH